MLLAVMQIFTAVFSDVTTVYAAEVTDNEEKEEETVEVESFTREHTAEEQEILSEEIEAE